MSGAGAAVGLLLGGWLTGLDGIAGLDIEGWRLTLLINVPIGIAAAALSPRFLPESESHPGELDLPGAVTGTLGLLGLVYGFSRAGSDGWTDTWTLASLVAGAVLLALFMVVESRAEHPLLPFRVFLNRTRAASFVAMFLAPAAMFAMFYFLSQYIQNVMGYSPIEAGLAFLPFCAGIVVAAGRDLQPDQPDRPSLPGRRRHVAVGRGALRVLTAALRHHLPGDRRHRQLRHRPAAVDHLHVARHGCDVRPAHADGRPPPAQRGLRHRLGRPQHDAAGRRRARSGDPRHGRDPDRDRPRRGVRDRGRAGGPGRRPGAFARHSSSSSSRSPVSRSSPRARPTRSSSAPG